jgi:hypothetical protein
VYNTLQSDSRADLAVKGFSPFSNSSTTCPKDLFKRPVQKKGSKERFKRKVESRNTEFIIADTAFQASQLKHPYHFCHCGSKFDFG